MLHVTCDHCGKQMRAGEDRYVVKIEVFAAHDPAEITEADLEEDHMEAVSELLRELEEAEETDSIEPASRRLPLRPLPDVPAAFPAGPAQPRIGPEIRFQRELRLAATRGGASIPSAPPRVAANRYLIPLATRAGSPRSPAPASAGPPRGRAAAAPPRPAPCPRSCCCRAWPARACRCLSFSANSAFPGACVSAATSIRPAQRHVRLEIGMHVRRRLPRLGRRPGRTPAGPRRPAT